MSNRPKTTQLEALVEFLEQNPGIAMGFMRTSQGKQETKRKWAQFAMQINALGGIRKNGPGWAKYWAEKKFGLKKLSAQYAAYMRQKGGGSGERCLLSELDKRLVAVMGGPSVAPGDSQLAVSSFPQMQSAAETPSTSQNTVEIKVEIPFDEPTPPPPSPTAETSREETAATAPPQGPTANLRRRPRRLLSRSTGDSDMERMAAIEEQRVEAERLSAEALADTSRRLDRLSDSVEHVAQAIYAVARALQQIADK